MLIACVGETGERRLREMISRFQNEPDADRSHRQWKEIEREVFGVEYDD